MLLLFSVKVAWTVLIFFPFQNTCLQNILGVSSNYYDRRRGKANIKEDRRHNKMDKSEKAQKAKTDFLMSYQVLLNS